MEDCSGSPDPIATDVSRGAQRGHNRAQSRPFAPLDNGIQRAPADARIADAEKIVARLEVKAARKHGGHPRLRVARHKTLCVRSDARDVRHQEVPGGRQMPVIA
jgi:hypothetical protein